MRGLIISVTIRAALILPSCLRSTNYTPTTNVLKTEESRIEGLLCAMPNLKPPAYPDDFKLSHGEIEVVAPPIRLC